MKQIKIKNKEGKEVIVNVRIATTKWQQMKGLMFQTTLDPNTGMLFIFPKESNWAVWNCFLFMDLDILFIDKNKRIVAIDKLTPAWIPTDHVESEDPSQYIIELNGGFCRGNKIERGDKVEFLFEKKG